MFDFCFFFMNWSQCLWVMWRNRKRCELTFKRLYDNISEYLWHVFENNVWVLFEKQLIEILLKWIKYSVCIWFNLFWIIIIENKININYININWKTVFLENLGGWLYPQGKEERERGGGIILFYLNFKIMVWKMNYLYQRWD